MLASERESSFEATSGREPSCCIEFKARDAASRFAADRLATRASRARLARSRCAKLIEAAARDANSACLDASAALRRLIAELMLSFLLAIADAKLMLCVFAATSAEIACRRAP